LPQQLKFKASNTILSDGNIWNQALSQKSRQKGLFTPGFHHKLFKLVIISMKLFNKARLKSQQTVQNCCLIWISVFLGIRLMPSSTSR